MNIEEKAPRLVDSHAHLDMAEFEADREDVIRRAFKAGLEAILCPADLSQSESLSTVLKMAQDHPEILAAAGIHPHQAAVYSEDFDRKIEELAKKGSIRAVGEIGLDFHYDFSPREGQKEALRRQLACAQRCGLPAILHSRLSGSEIISAVDTEHFENGGILHCFTEDWETARGMLDRGFSISFSGILTFPKAQDLRDVAAKIPLDRLLVETDSPYLVPVPFRGKTKRNEPAFVIETAKRLAEIKRLSFLETGEAMIHNFFAVFPFEKNIGQC